VLYPQNDDEGVGRNGKAGMGMGKEGGKGEGESGRRIKGRERRERERASYATGYDVQGMLCVREGSALERDSPV